MEWNCVEQRKVSFSSNSQTFELVQSYLKSFWKEVASSCFTLGLVCPTSVPELALEWCVYRPATPPSCSPLSCTGCERRRRANGGVADGVLCWARNLTQFSKYRHMLLPFSVAGNLFFI